MKQIFTKSDAPRNLLHGTATRRNVAEGVASQGRTRCPNQTHVNRSGVCEVDRRLTVLNAFEQEDRGLATVLHFEELGAVEGKIAKRVAFARIEIEDTEL